MFIKQKHLIVSALAVVLCIGNFILIRGFEIEFSRLFLRSVRVIFNNDKYATDTYFLVKEISDLERSKISLCTSLKKQETSFEYFSSESGNQNCRAWWSRLLMTPIKIDIPDLSGKVWNITTYLRKSLGFILFEGLSFIGIFVFCFLWWLYLRQIDQRHGDKIQQLVAVGQEREKFELITRRFAHDVRSPLTALSFLASVTGENSPQKQMLVDVSERISGLARDLLTSGRDFAKSEKIQVSEFLRKFVKIKMAEYNGSLPIKISMEIPTACENLEIDFSSDLLFRGLSNLLNNSIEASGSNSGTVELKVSADSTSTYLAVKDNGCGISPEVLSEIQQGNPVTSAKNGVTAGFGLGLSSVVSEFRARGVDLSFHSVVNQGTSITLGFVRGCPGSGPS